MGQFIQVERKHTDLYDKFEEVKRLIPFKDMGKVNTIGKDIMDWLKDYYKEPQSYQLLLLYLH